ncbi:MAG: phosphatase PAP2 family protein [Candidatus Sabulitectum sp.]|nr:phosphatase PAP2 family protein [Candidatus Sabulitectum sp.]
MKLLPRSRNFTKGRILIVLLIVSATVTARDVIENTLKTGENLFTAVPASILTAGAAGSFFAYKTEGQTGYEGLLPEQPFSTFDRVDDFLIGKALPISSAGFWIAGKLTDNQDMECTGEELCRGLLYSYGIVQTLKFATGRTRPDGSDNRSFPSGHAAGASCTATVLWSRYGPEAGIPLSLIALYTCLSRVNLGKHFPSDVVLGAAVGTACGIASTMLENDTGTGEKGFSISLSVDTEGRITPALW